MTYPELPQAASNEADYSLLLPLAILVVVGLARAAHKICVITTVLQNGRVVSRFRWTLNDLFASKAKAKRSFPRRISSAAKSPDTRMSPRRKAILSQIYNGQEIAFGLAVYCCGVYLATLATMQLGDSPIKLSPANTLMSLVLGLIAMSFGVFRVIRRKQNNPFSKSQLIL